MQRNGPLAAQGFALKPLSFKRGLSRRTIPVIVQNTLPPKSFSTPEATAGKTFGFLGRLESVTAVVVQLVTLFILMMVGNFSSINAEPSQIDYSVRYSDSSLVSLSLYLDIKNFCSKD